MAQDTPLAFRVPLYARSAIPEVWIVNLATEEVEIHRSPVAGL